MESMPVGSSTNRTFYEANGDRPICRESGGATEPGSRFLINNDSQCLVDLSSCKHCANVASRS